MNKQSYVWVVAAIAAVVLATVVPLRLLQDQTNEIELLTRTVICVSLAEQERLEKRLGVAPFDFRKACFGLTPAEIRDRFRAGQKTLGQ